MTDERWFELWLSLGQTVVGAAVTVLAVYLAALAALRRERQRAVMSAPALQRSGYLLKV